MSSSDAIDAPRVIDRLKGMGFKFKPEAVSAIADIIAETKSYQFSDAEQEVVEPILVAKTADIALLDGHDDITKPDVERMRRFCLIEHLNCLRSILTSQKIGASVLTAADSELLESIGISDIMTLSSTSVSEIVEKAVAHVQASTPTVNITTPNIDRFRRRVELWKFQAEYMLSVNPR